MDQSGAPTGSYRQLKNKDTAKYALADGIRSAYAALFEANEKAHTLPSDKLKGLVSQVAGTDDDMTARIVSTFNTLVKLGDFSARPSESEPHSDDDAQEKDEKPDGGVGKQIKSQLGKGLNHQFHYNIQIHLPSNATEEVYLNIFNAIRKVFQ